MNADSVIIDGDAPAYEAALGYARSLEASGRFTSVSLTQLARSAPEPAIQAAKAAQSEDGAGEIQPVQAAPANQAAFTATLSRRPAAGP